MWRISEHNEYYGVGYDIGDSGRISSFIMHVKSKINALKLIHYLNGGELESTILTRVMLEDEEYQAELEKTKLELCQRLKSGGVIECDSSTQTN